MTKDISLFEDNVYTILRDKDKWLLFRKAESNEKIPLVKAWEDSRGENWVYMFSAHHRSKLEECVNHYRIINIHLRKIEKVVAKEQGLDYGEFEL